MKIALRWMNDYVAIARTPAELAHGLTMNGLAVEEVTERDTFPGIVVGRVLEAARHPNADKLSVTRVDAGTAVLDIVCGAPNVAAGQWVAVATVGTVMPGGLEIKKAKIRGAESAGMICSRSELGLEEGKSAGIWELDASRQPRLGQSLGSFLGTADAILDIDVTSNRPDCLSYLGMAQEVSVLEGAPVKWPALSLDESGEPVEDRASVAVEDSDGCPRYAARVLTGTKIGPSPSWLKERLETAGVRSINNVVDVTNYVMIETGQPLHAFDYDTLAGHRIVVRRSLPGEMFTTLDGKNHRLTNDVVLICDGERPVALGGIMGGQNSEISETTTNILLESAYFTPLRNRRAARDLGMVTDASLRFGRGVDIERVPYALDRAAELIHRLAGGRVASGRLDVRLLPPVSRNIALRMPTLHRWLGKEIPDRAAAALLEKLGCKVRSDADSLQVTPPSGRLDLMEEVDLIEEVARLHGYNNLPSSTGASIAYPQESDPQQRFIQRLNTALREQGLSEVVTNSMVHPGLQLAVIPDGEQRLVRLVNPLSDDMSVMRLSMVPSLLQVVRENIHRDNFHVRIYEVGKTYQASGSELPIENTIVAGCVTGNRHPVSWDHPTETFDFFDLKAIAVHVCKKFNVDNIQFISYHENEILGSNSLEILAESTGSGRQQAIGCFGPVRSVVLRRFDIHVPVWLFEFDCARLFASADFSVTVKPIPRFPAVKRDLALVVDENLSAGPLLDLVRSTSGEYLNVLELFDKYVGDQIESGKKSLAFSLIFRASDRTLTEPEVDAILQRVIRAAEHKFGALLRA